MKQTLLIALLLAAPLFGENAKTRMFDVPDDPPTYKEGEPESITPVTNPETDETWDVYGIHDNRYKDPYPGSSQLPPALPPQPDYDHNYVTPPPRYYYQKKSRYDQQPQTTNPTPKPDRFPRLESSKKDIELQKKIDNAFYIQRTQSKGSDGYSPFENVQTSVVAGKVTLEGTVKSDWEKGRAESIVRQVNGVVTVVNHLRVIR